MALFCRLLTLAALFSSWAAAAALPEYWAAPIAESVRAAEAERNNPNTAALRAELGINTVDDGEWSLESADAVWRAVVRVGGARRFQLFVAVESLDAGAVLRLLDPEGILRPAAPLVGGAVQGLLPEVRHDRVLLELTVPAERYTDTRVAFDAVYRDFRSQAAYAKQKQAACHIDVVCPEALPHQVNIDAAVHMRFFAGQNTALVSCSGTLLNNASEDFAPLVLTAEHCGFARLSEEKQRSEVSFYVHFQRSECAPERNVAERVFAVGRGAVLLAQSQDTDFQLLSLLDRNGEPAVIPRQVGGSFGDPVYNIAFSGWSREPVPPQFGVTTHHPQGSHMMISWFDQPAFAGTTDFDTGAPVDGWVVRWARGSTEVGSSGGGLFNEAGLLVGQLYGGHAACDAPQETDTFGRFDLSWDRHPEVDRQLKHWLDPKGESPLTLQHLREPEPTPRPTPAPTPTPEPAPTIAPYVPPKDAGSGALEFGVFFLVAVGGLAGRRGRS